MVRTATQGFAGAMEVGLELRLPNDSVADRKTLHLEWTASAGSQATRPAFVVRQLESDEVAALLKRGEGFIASGDLASARLVLQRAAEAGEAQAALSLAGTFDPIVLEKLGLQGQKADIEKARIWYQRAQRIGISRGTQTAAVARGLRPMRRSNCAPSASAFLQCARYSRRQLSAKPGGSDAVGLRSNLVEHTFAPANPPNPPWRRY